MPQPLWTGKAEMLYMMMHRHEKEGRKMFSLWINLVHQVRFAKCIPWIWSFISQSRIPIGCYRKDPTSSFHCSLVVTGHLALKYKCPSWYHTNKSTSGMKQNFAIGIFQWCSSTHNLLNSPHLGKDMFYLKVVCIDAQWKYELLFIFFSGFRGYSF